MSPLALLPPHPFRQHLLDLGAVGLLVARVHSPLPSCPLTSLSRRQHLLDLGAVGLLVSRVHSAMAAALQLSPLLAGSKVIQGGDGLAARFTDGDLS